MTEICQFGLMLSYLIGMCFLKLLIMFSFFQRASLGWFYIAFQRFQCFWRFRRIDLAVLTVVISLHFNETKKN